MLLINLNLHVGICTLTGTLFKGLQTKTIGLNSYLLLMQLCNSSLSASFLYQEINTLANCFVIT